MKTNNQKFLDYLIIGLTLSLVYTAYQHQLSMYAGGAPYDNAKLTGDYVPFWAAGHMALEGKASLVYDYDSLLLAEKLIFPTKVFYLPWLSPPTFLLIMQPLALFDFATSYWLWGVLTSALYFATIWWVFKSRLAFIAAALFPAFVNTLFVGQTGALTGSLMIIGLLNLEKKPVFAGVMIGLLAIKPQIAFLIPIALLASQNWKAIMSATLAVLFLWLITTYLYGIQIWYDFFTTTMQRNAYIHTPEFVGKMFLHSVYGLFQYFGLDLKLGALVQSFVAVLMVVIVFFSWRQKTIMLHEKIVILIACSLMFHSYSLFHDYIPVFFAFGLLVRYQPPLSKAPMRQVIVFIIAVVLSTVASFLTLSGVLFNVFLLLVVCYDIWQRQKSGALVPSI